MAPAKLPSIQNITAFKAPSCFDIIKIKLEIAVKIKDTAMPANSKRKIETRPPTRDKKKTSAMASNEPRNADTERA
ncbi:hypothetical protein D9M71_709980 [compost metagenome]